MPTMEVDIPVSALIACPKEAYRLAPVVRCPSCDCFRGLQDRFPGSSQKPFGERFMVSCAGAPVMRPVLTLVSE